MTNRWKMNRIGFVNFWLYDEETFEFVDGKLLLRGQNGSGKSITTQSFIPFVLDGDRTPNRLDPFGSSDRRMEYYFLGEEGKDEATGYLFLEFKKAESEEYRTIGIGQRAKRGKPMDFWGFIIKDGRRVGYDLMLYKEVGSAKIPLDRREMKALLGETNFFTDSQSEYKKEVNLSIFGFRKPEQYEQFIKLLVKVRAPKLSKEFKPTKVYEILNDSLQTLTDEDLRAMVDAMEKMDEIQDSLELLNRAFADVKVIRNEYTRYNQYMLAKKAQAYLNKKQEVEKNRSELEAHEQDQKRLEQEWKDAVLHIEELNEEKKLIQTERSGLSDVNLEEMDEKLSKAQAEKKEVLEKEKHWDEKISECKERIFEGTRELKQIEGELEEYREELSEGKTALDELQDILQWDQHETAVQQIRTEIHEMKDGLLSSLDQFQKEIGECQKEILRFEELSAQYDAISEELESFKKQKIEREERLKEAQEQVLDRIEQWIIDLFAMEKEAKEWHPKKEVLKEAEEKVRSYGSVADAGMIQELLHGDYERQRQGLMDEKNALEHEGKLRQKALLEAEQELSEVLKQEDLEPKRTEMSERSRIALKNAGITAIPFYKTVEFSPELSEAAAARLEAQLCSMGILDALVVSEKDFNRIREKCPEFLDTILYAKEKGSSDFAGLVVNEELDEEIRRETVRILRNLYEEETGHGIYLGKDGSFRQGILVGKADQEGSAEYVGVLARKRRKEQKIQEIQEKIQKITTELALTQEQTAELEVRLNTLLEEYRKLPNLSEIHEAINRKEICERELQVFHAEYEKKEAQNQIIFQQKNQQYQIVLQRCKPYPYARTLDAYDEVYEAAEDYRRMWLAIRQNLQALTASRSQYRRQEDMISREEVLLDDAFVEKRRNSTKIKELDIQIRQFEEYLNRPENIQKAKRLNELRERLAQLENDYEKLSNSRAVLEERVRQLTEALPEEKKKLEHIIIEETSLRAYFEEELSLGLILKRESRSLSECAKEALGAVRDSDKTREPAELLQSLYKVYQGHNGTLTNYGTSLEDCFDTDDRDSGHSGVPNALRKRVRVVSVWNGKKVYLEEFYGILKTAIDETELLIQKKDRELFENILSQTISQQLTDRIAESRKWVLDMSKLMKEMDTSMGLSFSLDWKPHKAENDTELGTEELEQILLRDRALLTMEDIEKVAGHFRSRIRTEKMKSEESDSVINYMDLVRDALDYRKWFEFQMYYRRGEEPRKILTNAAFNRFSGGEKAMAMYVPLFAAVNAQYQKAENKDHPRMIALDEAFAGVDDKNISSMFELVQKLDFDYIMNSQALWGCFETVQGLRIAELLRPQNSQVVSVILYTWNGHERILDVQ